ncbi:hypothetical protein [Streptomyces colonosanans]|uniref:Uncharacterized protein n=1 Tax=Streptomyces colonosanans TaxID=1428652 RepID=A0A1S2Q3T1_9ACTN|nr:hypothetical protein [Streptomyces colonosanans]OIK00694.1 hypothetical protein BIV24_02895 [Streptomyces colonosanans]
MILPLEWPGFQLSCNEGILGLRWPGAADLHVKAERCVEASLRPKSGDESCQLVFRFKSAPPDATDLIVVRVSVPAAQVQGAEQLIQWLRREHGVLDQQADEDERAELVRVPTGSDGWVLAPTGTASEELFDEVMDRIKNDAD